MLVKLYERDNKNTVYDKYNINSSEHFKILKYCPHCNSDLFGEWNYDCRKVKVKNLDCNNIDEYNPEAIYMNQGSIFIYGIEKTDPKYIELMDITPLVKKYRQEKESFLNMVICPICGHELPTDKNNTLVINDRPVISLITEKTRAQYSPEFLDSFNKASIGSYIYHNGKCCIKTSNNVFALFDKANNESILKHFQSYRESQLLSTADNMLREITDKYDIKEKISEFPVDAIRADVDKLKNFLSGIIQIETSIFSISERLKSLYCDSLKYKPDAYASIGVLKFELESKVNVLNEEYDDLINRGAKNVIAINDVPMEYPTQPTKPEKDDYPAKPASPTLKKINFFNKKSATAENELATQKYNAEYTEYSERCKSIDRKYANSTMLYDEECKKFEQAVAEFEIKRNEIYDAKVSDVRIKLNLAIENRNSFEEISKSITTPEQAKFQLVNDEISKAEELLKSLFEAKKRFYGSGIIYEKYCEFVAVSSFYEYLCSGRCEKLEGTDGAYNIYENEIRLDTVISQLTQVVESLEQIKKNQYVIYSAIKESNKQLNLLNDSMSNVVHSLDEIKSNVSDINTQTKHISENTEISAYYSQINAFYSKKNAELTDALGFMLAFK